jgi:hypothetical protein
VEVEDEEDDETVVVSQAPNGVRVPHISASPSVEANYREAFPQVDAPHYPRMTTLAATDFIRMHELPI